MINIHYESINQIGYQIFYRIIAHNNCSNVLIIAPHGGYIESITSELAYAIAQDDMNLYTFESMDTLYNKTLHIPSIYFNEKNAIDLSLQSSHTISLHGCKGSNNEIFVGGKDTCLAKKIIKALKQNEFNATTTNNPKLKGIHDWNICNLNKRKRGVQLELSNSLRNTMFTDGKQATVIFDTFVSTIRNIMKKYH